MTSPQYGSDPNYQYQQPTSPAPYPPAPAAPYGQQPYQPAVAPGYAVPVIAAAPTSGVSVASMVLGIVGVTFGWFMLGIPCLLAIILGHVGINQTKNNQRSGRGMAIAGLVLGYVLIIPVAYVSYEVILFAHAVHNACVELNGVNC